MLQKQNVNISFAQGLDTKTDPKQVQLGKFLSIKNSVFTTGDLLLKRNGYKKLSTVSNAKALTTFNGNLTAIGNTISAYSGSIGSFVSKGTIQPMEVSSLPLIRNNLNQIQCDSALSSNGLVCTVYSESDGTNITYKYAIANASTGQNISSPVAIPVTSGVVTGSPRVFVLGSFFVVVFTNVITATSHLQYIAISTINVSNVTVNADIASAYISSPGLSWDGVVANNNLYVAYNTTSGGQSVKITYLNQSAASSGGAPVAAVTFATFKATLMSLCADLFDPSNPIIYVNFYRSDTITSYILAVDKNLNTVLAPAVTFISGVNNLTAVATNGLCYYFQEVANSYSYDSTIPTNYINGGTVTQSGTITSKGFIVLSVGLASKAFFVNGVVYFLSAYHSPYQNTYFLINGSQSLNTAPLVLAKIAYQNGGGYLALGLPSVTVSNGNTASISYLFKDLIEAVNKNTNVPSGTQVNGIYSQTGINLSNFVIGSDNIDTAEIGNDLNISGGFLWMYDGYLPVEQNFFLYPDSVECTWNASTTVTPTGTWASGSTTITVSSGTGITPGMSISDTTNPTYITAGTVVLSITGTTVVISQPTTHVAAGDTLSVFGNVAAKPDTTTNTNAYFYQVTYEWTDNQGNAFRSAPSIPVAVTTTGSGTTGSITVNVPTLRLTYKVNSPVKVVIYRWSVAQEIYYQVTSISYPTLNTLGANSITFTDNSSDATILGNNILYTNGGVLENTGPPATNIMTLFDTRLWLVDAEDRNLLWFSKQVIESTPVEMSNLLTKYIAPTTAAQGSTGPITALSVMDDKLIIFKKDAIYYINGTGPDNTGANDNYSEPIFITTTVGCNDQNSIVFMQNGLMFQSDKGIWLLGRDLSTQYIGAPVEEFNGDVVKSSINVPATTQVRFTLAEITLMYDYYYGQWGEFTGIPAISSTLFGSLHTFLNENGEVYQENPGSYLDGSNPVLLSFITSWLNMAGIQGYIRAYWFFLLGRYFSPHKLQLQIAYDYNPDPEQSTLIQPTNYSPAYGLPGPYGQGDPYGGPGDLEQWRVFLAKQRCQAIQITLNEVYDPSLGQPAGQGLSLSGINMVYAIKKGWRNISAAHSAG